MSRGVSIIELLIAFAIMVMTITAAVSAGILAPNIIEDARSASNALERTRVSLLSVNGDLSIEPLEDEQFAQQTAGSGWTTSQNTFRAIELSTIIQTATEPEACDPFTSGDWSHPNVVHTYSLTDLGGAPGTYSISSLSMSPDMLAVGIGSTSENSSPTQLLFQLSGTSTPQLIGAFDNASTSRIGNSSVVAFRDFAFSGNAFSSVSSSTCNQASNCAQIHTYTLGLSGLVSALTLSTSSEPFAYRVDGSNAPVSSLTYHEGYLYVGLQKTVHGDEFNIVDAHDPTHLIWLAGYPIGRTVNNIAVRNGLAYASTDDPSRELIIFDVHDVFHPTVYASWNAPGATTFGYGSASTIYKDSIRFGRTYSSTDPEFELLQLGSSSAQEVEHIDSGTPKDPESVRDLLTQDRLTFMLLTHRLDVLDTHNPSHAEVFGSYALPAGSQGISLSCRNNQLYMARNESDGSGRIDILQGS